MESGNHVTVRNSEQAVICIIGLGYVGLPLAQAFSKSLKVIGFDTDTQKVDHLSCLNYPNHLN